MSEGHAGLFSAARWQRLAAVSAIALSAAGAAPARADGGEKGRAKNVIVMVPDGMGLADVTATRIYKHGLDGMLAFETLEHIGYQRTYSANSVITDSAPAASAWACGEKFNNGEICSTATAAPSSRASSNSPGSRGRPPRSSPPPPSPTPRRPPSAPTSSTATARTRSPASSSR
jgi:alkaline phosphatase